MSLRTVDEAIPLRLAEDDNMMATEMSESSTFEVNNQGPIVCSRQAAPCHAR